MRVFWILYLTGCTTVAPSVLVRYVQREHELEVKVATLEAALAHCQADLGLCESTPRPDDAVDYE